MKDAGYTLSRIQSLLGLSRRVVTGLVAAGFVTPARGARGALRFGFQDVVLLRTALSLQTAGVPPRKIVRALAGLRERLPEQLPLTGLRIAAVGQEVAVWDGDAPLHAESGQWLIDFEARAMPGGVAELARATEVPADDAEAWFERGCALEAQDAAQAEAAWRQALAIAPGCTDAALNLGALLCEQGRCGDAVDVLRGALAHAPEVALLHYNLAVALEDLGRGPDALRAYEACLALEPATADAHYNVARLCEAAGEPRRALRHLREYRRLR